jgi:hypothetical protein
MWNQAATLWWTVLRKYRLQRWDKIRWVKEKGGKCEEKNGEKGGKTG